MSSLEIDTLWNAAFGESTRPELYAADELNEDGFQPLNDPHSFLVNIATLSHKQLYATSANNQIAMKLAQDEYLDLEHQIAQIKGKDSIKNPQSLLEPDVFEERKESALYGYKYEPNRPALLHAGVPGIRSADDLTDREKHDVRLLQEPFEQGGFVPKEKEYKAKAARAPNPKNIDGWQPVQKNGKLLIPKQQTPHEEYSITYVKRNVDENGEIVRPQSAGSDASGETPSKAVDKRLTRTRFDGKKFPPTRDVSEAPSAASTPGRKRANTPAVDGREDTPNSKRRKFNGPDRPKHPNQYTKARELAINTTAAQNGAKATSSKSSWVGLSPTSLRNRKWTDEELVEAVKHDHLWLHDDPNKAEDWKHKIINGINPVRSFSMFRKWAYWKVENKDKRPRAKKNLPAEEAKQPKGSPQPKRVTAKATKSADSGRTTPSTMTPMPENVNGGKAQDAKRVVGTRGGSNRRATAGIKLLVNHEDAEDDLRAGTETEPGSRTEREVSQQMDKELQETPASRPSPQREESDSMIVVNGTPPTRRSLRNLRRASG
ncbi:uncharacterized protein Z518_10730 [Rhinocladiella mackenziei CBS 650.93]|uniref:Rhinocladiella mackenziei CBS 650.93 unplaced genomic scaffold supercont1.10, whole genome shotgun sequence n=1 Tax=Rhinocladiella mackenziei CBS 650.93 TaxID=1442369 RepID=A0A0D2GN39_9EURO|nr:uncharacterized protein Z518_10730 [Rhinocladiella mackenziei CBS 650.93]KIW99802.1 hypothetical protein Z518_10730 [Rhinocladiella mackenziei CBS 650.93]